MAVHRDCLPTGVAHTSPGNTRVSILLYDFSRVWKACEVALKKASLQSDKPDLYWPHGDRGARCVSMHRMDASLLEQEQSMPGQHCNQLGVWEHSQYDKHNNVPSTQIGD